MKINNSWYPASYLSLIVGIIGAGFGLILGILAGLQPLLLCLAVFTVIFVICFFTYFEQSVLGLLILRSSLDMFSAQQIPAVFAVGLDALTILYVFISLLLKKKIYTDKFWWFLIAWIACQGLWVGLIFSRVSEYDSQLSINAIEEWVRLFSWAMVYFLIMQLKSYINPKKVINWLFLSLVAPLSIAMLQIIFPPSFLPSFLTFSTNEIEAGSRINGTLGHPNSLASFTVLFIALSLWKLKNSNKHLPWLMLIGLLAFVLTTTQSLGGIVLITTFSSAYIVTRLNLLNLVGAVLLVGLILFLFTSSDFGRERLASLYETPIFNQDISLSNTLLLAQRDGNSLNWRIAQWTYLLDFWKKFPIMGYGLKTASSIGVYKNYAHNDYIAVLVEQGIIGLFVFITFLYAQFAHLINIMARTSPRPTNSQLYLCSVLIALLTAICVAMFAANVISQTTLFFYWFTLMAVVGWDWSEQTFIEQESR